MTLRDNLLVYLNLKGQLKTLRPLFEKLLAKTVVPDLESPTLENIQIYFDYREEVAQFEQTLFTMERKIRNAHDLVVAAFLDINLETGKKVSFLLDDDQTMGWVWFDENNELVFDQTINTAFPGLSD